MKNVLTSLEEGNTVCRRWRIDHLWRRNFSAGADGICPGVGPPGKKESEPDRSRAGHGLLIF